MIIRLDPEAEFLVCIFHVIEGVQVNAFVFQGTWIIDDVRVGVGTHVTFNLLTPATRRLTTIRKWHHCNPCHSRPSPIHRFDGR